MRLSTRARFSYRRGYSAAGVAAPLKSPLKMPPSQTGLPFFVRISSRRAKDEREIRALTFSDTGELLRTMYAEFAGTEQFGERAFLVRNYNDFSSDDVRIFKKWIDLNGDVIIGYWLGKIESNEKLISKLQPIRSVSE